ncbi:MAG: acyl-CoA thioesterase [Bdellovibrionaceae bacterium]|nr:acyl-CoA thioesterase [Pseudobdellovibrionaceae bacterium]
MTFIYERKPHFYETDAMGIIHHGSYLLWMEEARVEFLRQNGVFNTSGFEKINYPVLNIEINYKKSILFEDEVTVVLSGKTEGVRLHFGYEIRIKRFTEPVAFGKTVHVAMDMSTRRPIRIPSEIAQLL